MKSSASISVPQIQVLDSINYARWRQDMRRQLAMLNLLPLIESDKLSIGRILSSAEGRENDKKAMAIISSRVGERYSRYLEKCTSAYEMWFTLKSKQVRLFNMKQIKESLEDMVSDSESDEFESESRPFIDGVERVLALASMKAQLQDMQEQLSNTSPDKLCQLCGSKKHQARKCPVSTVEIILSARRSARSCVIL